MNNSFNAVNLSTSGSKNSPLASLHDGVSGTIVALLSGLQAPKKFADLGFVAGTRLKVESRAPFGSLMRVKILDSSFALNTDDARNIIVCEDRNEK